MLVDLSGLLFFAAYGVWLAFSIGYTSFYAVQIDGIYKFVRIGCIALLFLAELAGGRHSLGSVIGIGLVGACSLIVRSSGLGSLIDMLLFIYCARDIGFRRIAKFSLAVMALSVAFVTASAYAGVITNYAVSGLRPRVYMGFRYALFPAQYVFMITCLAVYLRKDSLGLLESAVLLGVNYLVFSQTNSRLSFCLAALLIVAAHVMRFSHGDISKSKLAGLVFVGIFPLVACLALLLTVSYDPSVAWQSSLNEVLGGRLRLGRAAVSLYGIEPFGQEVHWVGNGLDMYGRAATDTYLYVDSLFVRVSIQLGWLVALLFVVLLSLVCKRAWNAGDRYLGLVLIAIAIHCLIDDLSLYLYYNTFLFLMGELASRRAGWGCGEAGCRKAGSRAVKKRVGVGL